MYKLNPKYESALLGAIIAIMVAASRFMETTPTNELIAKGVMGDGKGNGGLLYDFIIFGFPFISIPIVLRFTNRLGEAGLKNKWARGLIRYGFLLFFLKNVLLFLLLFVIASFGALPG